MKVKIGETWYDAREQAICIDLSAQDKDNIAGMHPDCDKYAVFPDVNAISPDEARDWMNDKGQKNVRYIVNCHTKEHRIFNPAYIGKNTKKEIPPAPGWHIVEAGVDGWITWNGGDCPLPDGHEFEVEFRTGNVFMVSVPEAMRWGHRDFADTGGGSDVIAYRPILKQQETASDTQKWEGEGQPPIGTRCICWQYGSYQGEVTVRYVGDEMCVLLNHTRGEEQCGSIGGYTFRPIHTPTERDEWIGMAEQALRDKCGTLTQDATPLDVLSVIYDAGLACNPEDV